MSNSNDSAIVGVGTHSGQPVRPDFAMLSPVDFADLPDPEPVPVVIPEDPDGQGPGSAPSHSDDPTQGANCVVDAAEPRVQTSGTALDPTMEQREAHNLFGPCSV